MGEMRIVRTKSGYAVAGGEPYYLKETRTRREAQELISWCASVRTAREQDAGEAAERSAGLFAEYGIGPVDYRDLQPSDLFTWCPEVPPKVVTEVRHLDSGASLILWEPDRWTRPCFAMTLMTPSSQAYGRLRQPVVGLTCGDVPCLGSRDGMTQVTHHKVDTGSVNMM